MKRALLKNLEHSQENTCVGVAFCLSYRPLGLQLSQKKTQARLFFCEQFKIFKSTYFEEHLQKTASICFTSKYYSGGEFGLGETSTECILFNQMQLYNLTSSINILIKFLTFLALFEFSFTPGKLGRYNVAQKSSSVKRKYRLVENPLQKINYIDIIFKKSSPFHICFIRTKKEPELCNIYKQEILESNFFRKNQKNKQTPKRIHIFENIF